MIHLDHPALFSVGPDRPSGGSICPGVVHLRGHQRPSSARTSRHVPKRVYPSLHVLRAEEGTDPGVGHLSPRAPSLTSIKAAGPHLYGQQGPPPGPHLKFMPSCGETTPATDALRPLCSDGENTRKDRVRSECLIVL